MLAGAASESLESHNERAVEDDLLEGQHFAGREVVESDLTMALQAALTSEVVEQLRVAQGPGLPALQRVEAAGLRVQLARRFHNDAATDVRRVRRKQVVRVFRLAGHADLPRTVEFDDDLPSSVRD
jgi:hypothetical protein